MKRTYEVRDRADKRAIREFLKREGQFLLPMLELVEQTEVAIDEVIQVMGRATIEAACTYHGLQLLFQHHLERQPEGQVPICV